MIKSTAQNKAFTLMELLVVIAIIALLLSILTPSLNKAKELSRAAVCRAHMKSAALGMGSYTAEWNDWLAGPNTSGMYCTQNNPANPPSGTTAPVQNMDWISPTLGRELSLPDNGYERLVDILNVKLACPSNRAVYDYVYTGSDIPINAWLNSKKLAAKELRYSSYSAALGFHTYPGADAHEDPKAVAIPSNFRPKANRVGNPSLKIYVLEGARYIKPIEGASFNSFGYQDDGGNFMLYGASVALGGDPFYNLGPEMVMPGKTNLREANIRGHIYHKYAFRHDQSINVIFFDGHSEKLRWRDSIKTSYYFPPGTKIINANWTADSDDTTGQVIK